MRELVRVDRPQIWSIVVDLGWIVRWQNSAFLNGTNEMIKVTVLQRGVSRLPTTPVWWGWNFVVVIKYLLP